MKPDPVEISFKPIDNAKLANLCGALDENLKQIEAALDVTIARRGEKFRVAGATSQTRLAAQALQNFYEQARATLSIDDIQLGLVEVAKNREAALEPDTVPVPAGPMPKAMS